MLSICIPIFNFNVTPLVEELALQAEKLSIPYEIVLIDDCSADNYKKMNEESCNKHIYIKLDKNIGRSKIRNLFLKYAKFDNFLFLDCDSLIISSDFVLKYIDSIKNNNFEVVCGGRIYDEKRPKRNKMLSWKYGKNIESQPYKIREISPYNSFMTNNFLISRYIFEKNKFDERINKYGHEDTLFGFNLKENGISIKHIDNPILNADIEDNKVFLEKTEIGIKNLTQLLKIIDNKDGFVNDVKILKFYKKIYTNKLTGVINFLFVITKPILKSLLIKGYINLKFFNFYKLGILIQEQKNNN